MGRTLESLFRYLDALQGRAPVRELATRLAELDPRPDEWAAFAHFREDRYERNLVRGGDWYNVWVMCWKNGQRSPIHDHTGSSCGVRVLRGTATVTDFAFAPNGHVMALASRDVGPGGVLASADDDLHQVSNLQAADADLVTLHVYSPALLRMGTYSLTERTRGEEVWAEARKVVIAFPENSETPVGSVQGWVTPNPLFFVRNHFDAPAIDRARWRLRVGGRVGRPRDWTWDELTALPERSLFATVECAGNGRSFLTTRVAGVQWGAGAIGHAEWTGVPLRRVLDESGVEPGAVEVVFEGADTGTEPDHPEPMHFARSLPLAKALDPDTLLVYRMNGEWLQPSHGFPLRLFVPGWYGVASVKWLTRVEVVDRPFRGYFQTVKYTVQRPGAAGVESAPVGPMAVKSEIFRPQAGAVLGLGTNRLFGVAWAGEEAVADVEVSTDGGRTWAAADLIGLRAPYSWTLWEYLWEVATPGDYALLARATSARGRVQPTQHDSRNGGYMIHHSRPIVVRVEPTPAAAADRADEATLLYDMNAYAEERARLPLDVDLTFSAGEGI